MTQPEALRLADALWQELRNTDKEDNVILVARWFVEDADIELRRLHEVNQALLEALETMLTEFDNGDVNDGEWSAIQKAKAAIAKVTGESK